jgi:hypothetical protein
VLVTIGRGEWSIGSDLLISESIPGRGEGIPFALERHDAVYVSCYLQNI